jgi:diaminohydroxyphosphoribosylaminopyrimidine deaminase/5-amino-6-(5-phosphoribosylamino)uracil reductase
MSGIRVTLKLATSLDGRIALADGTSQWITSSASRARAHEMRAAHDAVLVGAGTVLADDPLLTARTIPLPARQPLRIVADSHARTPLTSKLMTSPGARNKERKI